MKITIIGTGVFSMAMAMMINKKHKNIIMWTESQERYEKYLKDGCIKDVITNLDAPKNIKLTNSYEKACEGADVVFIVTAAKFVGSVCKEIKPFVNKSTTICIASKGIENDSCKFLSDIVYDELKNKNITVISGPTFALDMAYDNPVGLAIASHSKKAIKVIKDILENNTLKLRETNDLIGVQICGSIKNVIAMAAGMLDGMNYPESTQSFLITESLHDIKELIKALGGNPKTILSFAGIGDLLLTCTSTKSRNHQFGQLIGKGISEEEKQQYLKENTVEGYYTLKSIYKLVKINKIKIPIIDLINKIVMKNEPANILIDFLINKK